MYKVIDLFSGCGGLSLGFEMANYEIALGIDNWADALKTFEKNHKNSKTLLADLHTLEPETVSENFNVSDISVIVGGPPCQGFSIAGKREIDDERNKLYQGFVRFVAHFKPTAFVMENVPTIMTMGEGLVKKSIIADFESLGYKVSSKILMASDYGVPQNRKRAFFVGLLSGKKFEFPEKQLTQVITSAEAISDLPDYDVNDNDNYPIPIQSNYQKLMRKDSKALFNHQLTKHSQKTIETVGLVPDGGNYKNLPIELRDTRRVNIAWTRLNSQKPSFTIDTGHRHHFHYAFNRIPTVRESARIQSFPDAFHFLGTKTSQYKQVGNAVPPTLGKIIAEQFKNYSKSWNIHPLFLMIL
jgi:DNA (cytosine-5)-methyltransferase 1